MIVSGLPPEVRKGPAFPLRLNVMRVRLFVSLNDQSREIRNGFDVCPLQAIYLDDLRGVIGHQVPQHCRGAETTTTPNFSNAALVDIER